mmetsp:Transcript_60976/g.96945  ORF Transcript_60976/g.96945 Transcript_60976/m.96945 type:complete len:251 (-) Transcript_60976:1320-2072(-)
MRRRHSIIHQISILQQLHKPTGNQRLLRTKHLFVIKPEHQRQIIKIELTDCRHSATHIHSQRSVDIAIQPINGVQVQRHRLIDRHLFVAMKRTKPCLTRPRITRIGKQPQISLAQLVSIHLGVCRQRKHHTILQIVHENRTKRGIQQHCIERVWQLRLQLDIGIFVLLNQRLVHIAFIIAVHHHHLIPSYLSINTRRIVFTPNAVHFVSSHTIQVSEHHIAIAVLQRNIVIPRLVNGLQHSAVVALWIHH